VRPADPAEEPPGLAAAGAYLAARVADGLLPSAVLEVGDARRVLGRVTQAIAADAVYDLASLTKVLATGLAATQLFATRQLDLDAPLTEVLPEWRRVDAADIRVRDLLTHASGLPAHLPLYEHHRGSAAFVSAIAAVPLVAPPRTTALYSDLGFIVLGRVLEEVDGRSLDAQVAALFAALPTPPIFMRLPGPAGTAGRDLPEAGRSPADGGLCPVPTVASGCPSPSFPAPAPVVGTGHSAWRRRALVGEVHDDNAAAMGGVAGHAGLFGSVASVGTIARLVMRGLRGESTGLAPAWAVRAFARRCPVPGSSRALAWDTALPTSSSGRFLSPRAIGHTGFTGTSLWIDPVHERYVVLLTNRVAGRASAADMHVIRRDVHDILGAAWTGERRA
jgi:CubicO group peptidase (beta-lactamase class C family)